MARSATNGTGAAPADKQAYYLNDHVFYEGRPASEQVVVVKVSKKLRIWEELRKSSSTAAAKITEEELQGFAAVYDRLYFVPETTKRRLTKWKKAHDEEVKGWDMSLFWQTKARDVQEKLQPKIRPVPDEAVAREDKDEENEADDHQELAAANGNGDNSVNEEAQNNNANPPDPVSPAQSDSVDAEPKQSPIKIRFKTKMSTASTFSPEMEALRREQKLDLDAAEGRLQKQMAEGFAAIMARINRMEAVLLGRQPEQQPEPEQPIPQLAPLIGRRGTKRQPEKQQAEDVAESPDIEEGRQETPSGRKRAGKKHQHRDKGSDDDVDC